MRSISEAPTFLSFFPVWKKNRSFVHPPVSKHVEPGNFIKQQRWPAPGNVNVAAVAFAGRKPASQWTLSPLLLSRTSPYGCHHCQNCLSPYRVTKKSRGWTFASTDAREGGNKESHHPPFPPDCDAIWAELTGYVSQNSAWWSHCSKNLWNEVRLRARGYRRSQSSSEATTGGRARRCHAFSAFELL